MAETPDMLGVYAALDTYLTAEQEHATAEHMMTDILTNDFYVSFRGGTTWRGLEGLRNYLSQHEAAFDERLEIRQILSYVPLAENEVEITSRLKFFFRMWKAPSPTSREFSGSAFHTWRLRSINGSLRVASVIIDGFAGLNSNARELFAVPDEGFDE